MSIDLLATLAAYIPRDRAAYIFSGRPLADRGIALIADISGFTPLTEGLAQALSAARGAEELTRALNSVFAPLIAAAHTYGGSVVKFGGDALIVWFPQQRRAKRSMLLRRALAAAHGMQAAILRHGTVQTDAGTYTLTMKIGMAYGPVLRVYLGNVLYGYEDVIGGATLDRMAEAEHHAHAGEVVIDPHGLPELAEVAPILTQRGECVLVGPPYIPPRHVPIPLPLFEDPAAALIELRAYVPQEVYTALREGRPQPAELKPVVSIFVQFQGIRYEDGPAAEAQLAEYFGAAQRIAAGFGGRVNRLITGDKGSVLHLIFGAPRALEELELRAARCALALRELPAQMPFITAQRIGMATGRAFAGPVGAAERNDYTVMGDAINLSARLMQRADAGEIVIGPALAARLRSTMALTPLGPTHLKGKAAPVELFTLDGFATQRARPAAQVIGRDHELALLHGRLTDLAAGRGGIVLLSGELGMGKTHLLDALRREHDLRWVAAAATDYGGQAGGALIAAALRDLLALPVGADYVALAQATTALLGERAGHSAAPYLARLLGVALDERRSRELDALGGESFRWRLNSLVGEVVAAALLRGPLVIALDDLQWADPTSLELLGALLALVGRLGDSEIERLGDWEQNQQNLPIAQSPLLLMLAHRPDVRGRAEALLERLAASGATQVRLEPVDVTAARTIVAGHAPAIAATTLEQVIARGAGNPLFLVELARAAAVSGVDAVLPETIEGVLQAQIDRLAGPLRATLQLAAVLGPVGEPQLLQELIAVDEATTAERIAALTRAGFLIGDGARYRFRHTLIRESAYSALLYVRRREYHGAAAQAIERIFPAQIAERSAAIAMHYERAGSLLDAARYHGQAADAARLLDAGEEAEAGYSHVLALLEQAGGVDAMRGRTLLKLAQVKMNGGDYAAAQELYDAAFELLEQGEERLQHTTQQVPVFRMCIDQPETLDPGLCEASASEEVIANLFEGLVDLDDDFNVIPAAARRWRIEDNGRRYSFELRPDLHWSDGTPLTAHDFVFAWRRNLHPETGAAMAQLLYVVRGARAYHQGATNDPTTIGVVAVDPLHVQIELDTVCGYFPYLLTRPVTFPQPAHLIVAQQSEWAHFDRIVVNGVFQIRQTNDHVGVTLARNRYYTRPTSGNLETAQLFFDPHEAHRYETGGIDWMQSDRISIQGDDTGSLIVMQRLMTFFLAFAIGNGPAASLPLRQALAHSIDRRELVATVTDGIQRAATGGIVPPGMVGHSVDIGLDFDPERARVLWERVPDQAKVGLKLAALLGSHTPRYLAESWRRHLGLVVEVVENLPVEEIVVGLQDGTFQMGLLAWEAEYPDPDSLLRVLFHSASPFNCFGWAHAQFDRMVEEAAMITHPQERLRMYHAADQLLVAEQTVVAPLFYYQNHGLLRSQFQLPDRKTFIRGSRLRLDRILARQAERTR